MNQLYHFHFSGKCIVHLSIIIVCKVSVRTENTDFKYIYINEAFLGKRWFPENSSEEGESFLM